MKTGKISGLFVVLLFIGVETLSAQHGVRHQQPAFIELNETTLLEFEAPDLHDQQVTEAILFTRVSGSSSFSQQEGRFDGGRVVFQVEVTDYSATGLEYYLKLHTTDGQTLEYPDIESGSAPIRLDVVGPEETELDVVDFIDYTILSPRPGQSLSDEDLFVAVALFYDDEDVEGGEFRLDVNGLDMSEEAEISPFVIKYKPEQMDEGRHQMMIRFVRGDENYEVASWSFRAVSGEPVEFGEFIRDRRRSPTGNIELSARNQEIGGGNRDALTGRVQVSGQEGGWNYSMGGYLTSQEDSRLQPQNRFSADIRYLDRFHLQGGDVYPHMGSLSINGQRVRGLDSKLNLFSNYLELHFLMGRMRRGIDNMYREIRTEDRIISGQNVETLYYLEFDEQGRGTYQKNVIGGGITVGKEDRLEFSLHGLKVQDDTTSIRMIENYNDLLNVNPELSDPLSPTDRNWLEQNPENLQISGFNPRPRGNFVLGSALEFSLDNQRIRFRSEGGLSLLNSDISEGPLTVQRAEELGLNMDQDLENLIDRLSWLIIINEQMNTLPFRYLDDSDSLDGMMEVEFFVPAAIFANDSRLNLNYFDHQLQLRYQWVGPDYQSLANNSIRRDVSGFSVTDRFRFYENQFYATLGYENLNDNVLGRRNATLNTVTYRAGLSWFPVTRNLPRVSVSTRYRTRDNETGRFNPNVATEFENRSVRNFRIVDGTMVTAPHPRNSRTIGFNSSITQNFELLDLDHQLGVNVGLTRTEDDLFDFGDSKSLNASLRLTTRLDRMVRPLRVRLGYSVNHSESLSGLSEVEIQGVDMGAETFLLDGSLSVNVELALTRNRIDSIPLRVNDNNNPEDSSDNFYEPGSEDDMSRRHTNAFSFRSGLQYMITGNHAVHADVYLTNISDALGNLDTLYNDRILQVRYIFSF